MNDKKSNIMAGFLIGLFIIPLFQNLGEIRPCYYWGLKEAIWGTVMVVIILYTGYSLKN